MMNFHGQTAPQDKEPLERRTNIQVLTVVKDPDDKLIAVERLNDLRKVFIVAYVPFRAKTTKDYNVLRID